MKKFKRYLFLSLIVASLSVVLFNSCKKDEKKGPVPIVTSYDVTNIKGTTADCGGVVVSDEGSTVIERGVCWSTNPTPTVEDSKSSDGAGAGAFTSHLTGMTPNTTYFARAYATNANGSGYGNAMSFTTQEVVTDIDGNEYEVVTIGTQKWMSSNLKVTHYRNGEEIPIVTDENTWSTTTSGAYCNIDDNPSSANTYGLLYNFYVISDTRNIAPAGWHVPTYDEWMTMINYLGGTSVAGMKLKETGTLHWQSPNLGATNESGFTALPAGMRYVEYYSPYYYVYYTELGTDCYFWSSTTYEYYPNYYHVDVFNLNYYSTEIPLVGNEKFYGLSIRCVKD